MGYKLPTFNLLCNIWDAYDFAVDPPAIDPSFPNVPCNLQYARKMHYPGNGIMFLLLPKGTDVEDATLLANSVVDIVEVPAGSKRWYCVMSVDDVMKGFPTEYRCAEIKKAYLVVDAGNHPLWNWPEPYP